MSKYVVTLRDVRQVDYLADVEVEAEDEDEAATVAEKMAADGKVDFGDSVSEDYYDTYVENIERVPDAEVPGDVAGEA